VKRAKLASSLPQIAERAQAGTRLANAASARRIAAAARSAAPRRSGDLADSIKAKSGPSGDERVVVEDWKGHLVEFGTVRQPARPFLVPAAEAERVVHVRAIRELFR
jgi:HK97 gp10 family phage protein